MSSIPEQEAENPAPRAQQGKKAKMAPRHDAPPGLEQDGLGNTIPLDQRTEEDQQRARAAAQHKS